MDANIFIWTSIASIYVAFLVFWYVMEVGYRVWKLKNQA